MEPIQRTAVDLVARESIASHERHCGERWADAKKAMDGVNKKIGWLVGVLIAGQGAVIIMLLTKAFK